MRFRRRKKGRVGGRVRLHDFADDHGMIVGAHFEGAIIEGPAMVIFLGNCDIERSGFSGTAESVFFEVERGRDLAGVFGFRDVTIRDCHFRNVGVVGVPEDIAAMRAIFTIDPEGVGDRRARLEEWNL